MGSCYSSSVGKKTRSNGEILGVEEVSSHSSATTAAETHRRNKKKSSKENKSACDVDESVLRHIPGRIFTNDASKIASLYTQQGKKGTNQDAMLLWENFSSSSDTVFCGVFDGHGPFGHMVAKRVRDSLPLLLCSQWKASSKGEGGCIDKTGNNLTSTNSEETVSVNTEDEPYDSLEVEEAEKLPEVYLPLKRALLKAFKLMDKELKFHPAIDCFCSGTTAVTLIKQGQDIVISNVGDSRAVLATRDKDDTLLAVQLTVDLKPDLPREAARIQQCKGRIFALQDEPEVARVWLPNNDSPGLAMARAFGDFCLKDFGLISVPDVYYHRLTERDEFIILATDGIWDVLSNKEAVDIVASAPGRSMASRALVECAVRAWRLKYPTSKNDDCAAVCLFLDHSVNVASEEGNIKPISVESIVNVAENNKNTGKFGVPDGSDALVQEYSGTIKSCDEIVPISELEKPSVKYQGQPKRSLAECISAADDEWSALEGITRVNSLVSLPRILSSDSRTNSWRKWLSYN